MLRNYLAAMLRNLVRNRLYAAINIVGLAVGFAAAILIAAFVHDELGYDKWIPDHQDIYHVLTTDVMPGQSPIVSDRTFPNLAALLKQQNPSIEAIARLAVPSTAAQPILRRGEIEAKESLYYADPGIFAVLPLPAVAGDLKTALRTPDSIVLTRSLARKYFGRDDPIGGIVEIDRKYPMRVTAVLEDLPAATHLGFTALASDLAPFSQLYDFDVVHPAEARFYNAAYTYLRVTPGTDIAALQRAMPVLDARPASVKHTLTIEPITAIHLRAAADDAMKPSTSRAAVYAVSVVAVLIVLVAGVNFINLMTARATRRAVEVGVRKVSGAERRDLVLQFIGEATGYALLGLVLAQAVVAFALPSLNAFLDRAIVLRPDPAAVVLALAVVLGAGVMAGSYPALVLSAFHPAAVLAGGRRQGRGSGRGQRLLVTLQFAVLLVLILAGAVIWRQTLYAMSAALRFDSDAVLVVSGSCPEAFQAEVVQLPGVRAAACSMGAPIRRFAGVQATGPNRQSLVVGLEPVDFGLLELYGLRPVAGRFFSRDHAADAMPATTDSSFTPQVVLNETAVRALGFASPAAAVGASIAWGRTPQPVQVIGVAPDFPLSSVRDVIPPAIFDIEPRLLEGRGGQQQMSIKLSGRDVPETLAAIDRVWRAVGDPSPISRVFADQHIQQTYAEVTRQAEVFGMFAGIALFIACLGLFGLAAFTAERRTKEIGIRKALGAGSADILRLLVWEFAKPVLLANLIAWPVGYVVMRRWLEGFAYHVTIGPWVFLAASALALVIAVATVSGHALLVARAEPAAALRYE